MRIRCVRTQRQDGGTRNRVDHHELRRAFSHYLAAKRALQEAYRESEAPRGSAELRLTGIEQGSVQTGDYTALSEELLQLKYENKRLRKSVDMLHVYSLRLQHQLESLLLVGKRPPGVSQSV